VPLEEDEIKMELKISLTALIRHLL